MSESYRGILFAVCAFCLFASLPAYVQFLQPLSGYVATGQRVIWTVLLLGAFLMLFNRQQLRQIGRQLLHWRGWPGYLLGSVLVGVQFWAFIWGPMNGKTLDVALGYFMLPLMMVITGRLIYGERLRLLQWLAVGCAAAGVASAVITAGGISWLALVIALGYPPYFVLRRYQPLPAVQAFSIENLLLLPVAIWACAVFAEVSHPMDYPARQLLWLAGLGVLGAIPMLLWLSASRMLPLGLLGLIGYLEPTLVFCVGLTLGEQLAEGELPLYLLVASSLCLLSIDGVRQLSKRKMYT